MTSIQKIVYRIATIFFRFLGLLPLKWLRNIGRMAGRIFFLVSRKYRELTIENLTCAFGHEKSPHQIRRMACHVIENLMQVPCEMALIPKLRYKDVGDLIRVEGFHHIEAAHKKGKGVLCLTAHIGNWEIIPSVLSLLGDPPASVGRPLEFRAFDLLVSGFRTWHGGSVIPTGHSMRIILKALKQGSIVGILLDQRAKWHEGVLTDFFGRLACTNKGLALLALKIGAPVVPIFLVRDGSRFKMCCNSEVRVIRTGYKAKDIEINTQAYTKIVESMVLRYPTQWNWCYKRWKIKTCEPWPGTDST